MSTNTAWINSCKLQGSGWLVNGNVVVVNIPTNGRCQMVLEWIAEGNTPAPEFTDAQASINAQAAINETSRAYLAFTDWYVIRKYERSIEIPSDITEARKKAADAVIDERS